MKVYTRICLATLPLVLISLLASAGFTYHASRKAMDGLAEKWLETKVSEAVKAAGTYQEMLLGYGLAEVDSSVKLAQHDAGTKMSAIEVGERGCIIAVDSRGIIIVHPDHSQAGGDVSGQDWFRAMKTKQRGRIHFSLDGEKWMAMHDYFEPWQWHVLAGDPMSEVYSGIRRIGRRVMILCAAGMVLLALVLMYLAR